ASAEPSSQACDRQASLPAMAWISTGQGLRSCWDISDRMLAVWLPPVPAAVRCAASGSGERVTGIADLRSSVGAGDRAGVSAGWRVGTAGWPRRAGWSFGEDQSAFAGGAQRVDRAAVLDAQQALAAEQ